MIDTVEKMKEDGYYLVRYFEDSGLAIEEVSCGQLYCNGDYYSFDSIHVHWIADKPLDLDDVMRVHLSGGSDKMIEGIISTYLDCFS